tara:strand:- start:10239 stop:10409 length:171 start_codon:yes stop_codon:yes gene_type:complete
MKKQEKIELLVKETVGRMDTLALIMFAEEQLRAKFEFFADFELDAEMLELEKMEGQ